MIKKEEAIFKLLLKDGVIGADLSALLYKEKGQYAAMSAIARAAILASFEANENARKTGIPLILEEDNVLYEIYSDGRKKRIKDLPKSNKILHKHFTLK